MSRISTILYPEIIFEIASQKLLSSLLSSEETTSLQRNRLISPTESVLIITFFLQSTFIF